MRVLYRLCQDWSTGRFWVYYLTVFFADGVEIFEELVAVLVVVADLVASQAFSVQEIKSNLGILEYFLPH